MGGGEGRGRETKREREILHNKRVGLPNLKEKRSARR